MEEDLNRPKTREDYIQRGRVLLMGGKGTEDLVEILRITSANIIQVSSPVIECVYKDSCKYNLTPLYIPRIKHFYFTLSPIDTYINSVRHDLNSTEILQSYCRKSASSNN